MSATDHAAADVQDLVHDAGWSDGLPVVPPTRDLVDRFIDATGRPGDEIVAEVPPMFGAATIEKVAANAVMAGCRPEYMPVVVKAIELLVDDRFNVGGMQCSTHMSTPLVIIHGPIRHELGVNCGANVFGQGWRANATIGRAVKLVLVNLGGSRPGAADKATLGHPGKYTYCVGENEEDSPWEPLHVRRGLKPEDSAVTVYGCEGPHNINNQMTRSPYGLLTTIASMMTNLGSNHVYLQGELFIVLCPEHAAVCARESWKVADVQQFLFDHARVRHGDLKVGGIYGPDTRKYNTFPRWIDRDDDEQMVPVTRRVGDVTILVTGGPGRHSAYLPGWGSRSVTGKIDPITPRQRRSHDRLNH